MGQLLKVTSVPYQSIHFTQNARLVPIDNMDVERRKAMARHFAFHSRYSGGGSAIDLDYVNQVNKAFSNHEASGRNPFSLPGQKALSSSGRTPYLTGYSLHEGEVSQVPPTVPVSSGGQSQEAIPAAVLSAPVPAIPEPAAAYTAQRGSFELRVAKGELSYIPPLVMTIITQYPEIHFEYTGGFHYFPPPNDSSDGTMDLSI